MPSRQRSTRDRDRDRSRPLGAVARFVLKAVAVAAVVTVPLALLDLDAFWRSAVLLQLREPFRLDSLSFTRELLQFGIPLDKQGRHGRVTDGGARRHRARRGGERRARRPDSRPPWA